jgi:hypothetical protein
VAMNCNWHRPLSPLAPGLIHQAGEALYAASTVATVAALFEYRGRK